MRVSSSLTSGFLHYLLTLRCVVSDVCHLLLLVAKSRSAFGAVLTAAWVRAFRDPFRERHLGLLTDTVFPNGEIVRVRPILGGLHQE